MKVEPYEAETTEQWEARFAQWLDDVVKYDESSEASLWNNATYQRLDFAYPYGVFEKAFDIIDAAPNLSAEVRAQLQLEVAAAIRALQSASEALS